MRVYAHLDMHVFSIQLTAHIACVLTSLCILWHLNRDTAWKDLIFIATLPHILITIHLAVSRREHIWYAGPCAMG